MPHLKDIKILLSFLREQISSFFQIIKKLKTIRNPKDVYNKMQHLQQQEQQKQQQQQQQINE